MSGSPKRSRLRLQPDRQRELEATRRQAAEAEARKRAERERREIERLAAERRRLEAEERALREALQVEARLAAEALARRREAAHEVLTRHQGRLAALREDEVVATWSGPALDALEERLAGLSEALRAERHEAVEAAAADLEATVAALLEAAQARQLLEEQRHHVVESLSAVLTRQGFHVAPPTLAQADDLDSAVVLRAVRPDRRRITVAVPAEGLVSYELEGYPKRVGRGPDGRQVATCDEAEDRLAAIAADLARAHGVEMGPLSWDDQDPDRLRKGARELPGEAPSEARTQGGAP